MAASRCNYLEATNEAIGERATIVRYDLLLLLLGQLLDWASKKAEAIAKA